MSILECRRLNKIFRQGDEEIHAVRDIDLRVEAGELVSLSGPSGCGKSTLLHLVGGLLPPTSGEIEVDGRRVDRLSPGELADLRLEKIGFVFQAYNLVPVLSARENVEFILQLQGVGRDERRRRSMEALDIVGVAELAERRPARLSGGQQQRVAVARALVGRPAILIADEPSANLDSHNTELLLERMTLINREQGTTILVASHDPLVIDFTRRKLRLRDGAVEADESD